MAVAIENPETLSDGDGATASFPTVWTFETAAEVVVTVRGTDGVWSAPKVEGVDYDLTGTDWPLNGATVVFRAGKIPADDTQVLRRRVTPTAQAVPFGDQANFRPRSSEETFDRLTRQVQEERAKSGRALSVPPGEGGQELPPAALREDRLYVGGGAGEPLKLMEGSEVVVILNADGEAVGLPLTNVFAAIGTDLFDDGLWEPAAVPSSNDDGVWG